MWMLGVVMAGNDKLRIDDSHPLQPFLCNLCHKSVALFIVGKMLSISRRKRECYMLYWFLAIGTHGCLNIKAVSNRLVVRYAYPFVSQQIGSLGLALVIIGIVDEAAKVYPVHYLSYHDA